MVAAAHEALDRWGYGMASVRFICGTQSLHRELEERLSAFLGTEDTILFSSCFDANGGLFEALLDERGRGDLRRSSTTPRSSTGSGSARRGGCATRTATWTSSRRGCARRADARYRLIATDGVFSMDGYLAKLDRICDLADRHDALVMVDDSHAVGFVGPGGRGTPELLRRRRAGRHPHRARSARRSAARAAATSRGRREIVELLRQRSRPYLFSNSLAPPIVGREPEGARPDRAARASCATGCERTPRASARA